MSLLASTDKRREASESSGSEADRRFHASLQLRLKSFRESADKGEIEEGTIWLVRIIEAGKSLNGPIYTEEALKAAVPVFEGAPVMDYSWSKDPGANDADHLPDEIKSQDPRGLTGNMVGTLEGVHYNEEAKALDGYLKVYDAKHRERLIAAYKLGDIGEGGNRDVFGLSIDAIGDTDPETNTVHKITLADEVTLVKTPAAGGRIRRLVASTGEKIVESLTHDSNVSDQEPEWGQVDKGRLPDNAFANETRGYPHHFVVNGGDLDEAGHYTTGDMFLHVGGLNAAWAAAMGARSGQKASPEIVAHLRAHRDALGLEESVAKTKLNEKLTRTRLKEAATELGERARFRTLLSAVRDELSELEYGERSKAPIAEKSAFVSQLANDLVTELGSGGMQESLKKLKEAAATFAGQLKIMADQLSAATDEEAPAVLLAIKEQVDMAVDEITEPEEVSGEEEDTSASQEAKSVKTKNEQSGAANATQDDFARMSAGMAKVKEALRSGDPVKLREAAIEAVGEEPQQDERDREIKSLKERLKGQAIAQAMSKLTEELRLKDPSTVLTLIDRESLSFDNDFSEVKGLREAIKAVLKGRDYFVNAPATESAPAPAPEAELVESATTTPPAAPAPTTPVVAAPAAEPLGQNVPLRESAKLEAIEQTPAVLAQLKRYEKLMVAGNVRAMKKHRDLRARCGL